MKIKAIAFDQDETLIHADTGLYERYIEERAKDFARAFGIADLEEAKKQAFKMKIEKCDDSTLKLYEMMGIPLDIWYAKINAIDVRPYLKKDVALQSFLDKLRRAGLRTFLVTNSPTSQTKKILQAVGVSPESFDRLFTWELGQEPPKPSEWPFLQMFNDFGLKPEECIMVGNEIRVDLQTAHRLGLHTIGIHLETPQDKNVDFTINTLDDLFSIIEQLERG
jgi:FMN phosphatase YigB (HAD superfamily)